MSRESQSMIELHQIRERNHEATKNMTNKQKLDFIKAKAEKAKASMAAMKKVNV